MVKGHWDVRSMHEEDGVWARCLAAHGIPVHLTLCPAGKWTAGNHALGFCGVSSHGQMLPSTLFNYI